MDDTNDDQVDVWAEKSGPSTGSRTIRSAALVAGGLVAGGVLAAAVGASAATGTETPSTQTSAAQISGDGGQQDGARGGGIGGSRPIRSDEKQVTGADADVLRAAALKAVPGGTVVRIETDAGDAVYEVHMTKSDGSVVTVKFDSKLAFVRVESGMGTGDPAPDGARGGQGGSPEAPGPST